MEKRMKEEEQPRENREPSLCFVKRRERKTKGNEHQRVFITYI
jgi:hypothetical protein